MTFGLVSQLVKLEVLLDAADALAKALLGSEYDRTFGIMVSFPEACCEYQVANLTEGVALADSCLS